MPDILTESKIIEKEMVENLNFSSGQNVNSDAQRLRDKLKNATRLGNIEHAKCRIYFMDDEGPKHVQTTIWATGETHIVLKGGITIPIHRIVDVKLI